MWIGNEWTYMSHKILQQRLQPMQKVSADEILPHGATVVASIV